jgi:hypothetical protein
MMQAGYMPLACPSERAGKGNVERRGRRGVIRLPVTFANFAISAMLTVVRGYLPIAIAMP